MSDWNIFSAEANEYLERIVAESWDPWLTVESVTGQLYTRVAKLLNLSITDPNHPKFSILAAQSRNAANNPEIQAELDEHREELRKWRETHK